MRIAVRLFVLLLVFGSCTKINFTEYSKNPGQLRFCNIATWKDVSGDEIGDTRTNVFTYDENGNPLSVTSDQHGTGRGFHFFTYDDQKRLATYEYEFAWTKVYHYEEDSKQADSASVTDAFEREFSEVYTYDIKGRIIKSVRTLVESPFPEDEVPAETTEYVYLNDNLGSILFDGMQVNPDVTYSEKPSIYKTNKVWQFINQNYSKNAPEGVVTRNRIGLPLTFNAEAYQFPFLDIQEASSTVKYQCE